MTKAETVYTEQVVIDMVEQYERAEDSDAARAEVVAGLAEQLGVGVQSIRAKLVREGVYVAKERKAKDGAVIVRKAELVDQIAEGLGIEFTDGEGVSMEKATKSALKRVLAAVEGLCVVDEVAD